MPRNSNYRQNHFFQDDENEQNNLQHMHYMGVEIIELAQEQTCQNNDLTQNSIFEELDINFLPPLKLQRQNACLWSDSRVLLSALSQ